MEDHEADERRRRAAHLLLLERLFGETSFRTADLIVEAVRDYKTGLKVILFNRPQQD